MGTFPRQCVWEQRRGEAGLQSQQALWRPAEVNGPCAKREALERKECDPPGEADPEPLSRRTADSVQLERKVVYGAVVPAGRCPPAVERLPHGDLFPVRAV